MASLTQWAMIRKMRERGRAAMEPAAEILSIINLTSLILRKNPNHFLCIAILWILPSYAFHLPVLDLPFFALDTLAGFLLWIYRLLIFTEHSSPSSPDSLAFNNGADHDPSFARLHLFASYVFATASFVLAVTISLISYLLLTYSVHRAFLNKNVWVEGSLRRVLRSAKDLALTSLCVGVVTFGFNSITLWTMGIIGGMVVLVLGHEHAAAVSIFVSCTAIAIGVGGVYLTVLFSLAQTAAILEEKTWGWEAMKRSMDLLKGRKRSALGLVCVFYALLQPCKISGLWRWRGAQIVSVSLHAIIAMFGVAANIVLYMTCKSAHKEESLIRTYSAKASSHIANMDVERGAVFFP